LKGVTVSIRSAPGSIGNQGGPLPQRRQPVQRWLLHVVAVLHRWAESGRARSATATWGFVQSSILPGPPDALIIPLGLADPKRVFAFAFWTTVGSFFGALTVFAIGAFGFEKLGIPLFSLIGVDTNTIQHAREMFGEHALLVVLIGSLGLLPIPANVMSIASGGFGVPLLSFAPVFLVGRSTRYVIVAVIIRFAGGRLVGWIERRVGRRFTTLR
jgi:membrane protein YqaA with SNARE-associated domain